MTQPSTPTEQLAALTLILREGSEGICAEMTDPDADWTPVLALWANTKEAPGSTIVGLDPAFFEDSERKDTLAEVMMDQLVTHRASAAAFLCSAWVSSVPLDEAEQRGTQVFVNQLPSEDPQRKEALMLIGLGAGELGSEPAYFAMASIVRSTTVPPMLGPWDEAPAGQSQGRMASALRLGLQGAGMIAELEATPGEFDPVLAIAMLEAKMEEFAIYYADSETG